MKSKGVRELAFTHKNDGKSAREIAAMLKVSQGTIQLWFKQGPMHPMQGVRKIERANRRTLTPIQEGGLLPYIEAQPDSALSDIIDFVSNRYCVRISRNAVSRILKRNDTTRKRGTRQNIKYGREKGVRFLEDVKSSYTDSYASIDEMSVMLNLAPSYGYAKRGQRAVIRQPGKRTVSYMLTLCVSPKGVLHWDLRSGSITAEVFCDTLKRLPDGLTLMLDNARIHYASKCLIAKGLPTVKELAASKSISLKYIPAYAPHLNPVEFNFNTVRNLLRRKEAWTLRKLETALESLFRTDSFCQESQTKLFHKVIFWKPRSRRSN